MTQTYACLIVDGVVADIVVGTSEWAEQNLEGVWRESESKIGVGWMWDENNGFRPPQPYPSWVWDGQTWQAPVPAPDGFYYWDERQLMWVEVDDPFTGLF